MSDWDAEETRRVDGVLWQPCANGRCTHPRHDRPGNEYLHDGERDVLAWSARRPQCAWWRVPEDDGYLEPLQGHCRVANGPWAARCAECMGLAVIEPSKAEVEVAIRQAHEAVRRLPA